MSARPTATRTTFALKAGAWFRRTHILSGGLISSMSPLNGRHGMPALRQNSTYRRVKKPALDLRYWLPPVQSGQPQLPTRLHGFLNVLGGRKGADQSCYQISVDRNSPILI